MQYPIRINKYLALNNLSTRRGADILIERGLVFKNGKKALLGDLVCKEDKIEVKNIKKDYIYYAYNKPIGISTNKEPKSKDILSVTKFPPLPNPPLSRRRENNVFPIGRLDKDSHGLILMTNDGRVTDRLLSPKYFHEKEYVVKVEPNFTDKFLKLLEKGVRLDDFTTKKCKAFRKESSPNIFHIILTEGKKHQIRRMCEALHHKVIDLKRIRIMNIELGKLKNGEYREIKGEELSVFLKSLNLI